MDEGIAEITIKCSRNICVKDSIHNGPADLSKIEFFSENGSIMLENLYLRVMFSVYIQQRMIHLPKICKMQYPLPKKLY